MNAEKRKMKLLEHRREVNFIIHFVYFNRLKGYGNKNQNNSKLKNKKKSINTHNYKQKSRTDNKLQIKKSKDY